MSEQQVNIKTSKLKNFFFTVLSVLIGVAIALLLRTYVFVNAIVPTESMEPTIMVNDRLIGSKLTYINNEPERGDIVTFKCPDDTDTIYVKRIIGLPGEKITIVSGEVYINDSDTPLSEPYVNWEDEPDGDFGPYVVPENCYFVMGDNRNNSLDSRYFVTSPYISKEDITSKIAFRYYSSKGFDSIGTL